MRGNSGFLRWTTTGVTVLALMTFIAFPSTVQAGPARTRRMMRDVFASQETDPSAPIEPQQDSQDTCTLNGKEVLRSSVKCEKQPGCRKIETRGECCPIYQCDCEDDGTVYKNGAKVLTHLATTPCHVCLCRGGEIKCTNVTCYSRSDCGNTTFIEGVCCPEYNDCPPLEDIHFSGGSKDPYLSTETPLSSSPPRLVATTTTVVTPTSTTEEPQRTLDPDNPLGIKIKEITKPEEIRITDDKPKPFKPPIRSSSEATISFDFPIHEDIIEEENPSVADDNELTPILPEETEVPHSSLSDSVDDLTPLDNPEEGFHEEEAGVKNVRQTEFSTSTQEPIAVVAEIIISDKLLTMGTITDGSGDLMVASSTPTDDSEEVNSKSVPADEDQSSRIVIVDGKEFKVKAVDGLQRGVDEEDDRKSGRKSNGSHMDQTITTIPIADEMGFSSTTEGSAYGSSPAQAVDTVYYEPATEGTLSKEIFDEIDIRTNRPLTSAEIISIYEQESMLKQSTEPPPMTSEEIISRYEESLFKHQHSAEGAFDGSGMSIGIHVNDQFTKEPEIEGSSSDESMMGSSTPLSKEEMLSSTAGPVVGSSESEYNIEDRDKNPEFPEQPDDYSVHSQMQEEDAKSRGMNRDQHGEERASALVADTHSLNGLVDELTKEPLALSSTEVTTPGPPEGSSESDRDQHNFSDVQERSPGEPFLVPEWERNTTTEATPLLKFDRKDSLILLPVNDPIVKTFEEKPEEPQDTSESTFASSSVATSIELELDDASAMSSSTEHLTVVNEVSSSAESRNAGDDYSIADQLFGTSKLNKFLRMPGDLFRYREKIMNS